MARNFDAILFDLGNTLLYFDSPWIGEVLGDAYQELLRVLLAQGFRLDGSRFLSAFQIEMDAYYKERDMEFIEYTTLHVLRTLLAQWGYPNLPDARLRPALAAMYAVSQAHWQPEADAIPTLRALQGRGYRLGLISNASDDDDVQFLVDKACLRPYLETIVSSAAAGVRKPNPLIFFSVLAPWNIPSARAVMVGDSLGADVLGALNAGLTSVWITRRAATAANLAHEDTIQPDYTIAALSELPGLMDDIDR